MSAKSDIPAAVLDATTPMVDVEMRQTVYHFIGGSQTTVTAPIDAWEFRPIDTAVIVYRGVTTILNLAHVTHSETRIIITKVRKDKAS